MQATLQQQILSEQSGIQTYAATLNETSGNPIVDTINLDTIDAGFTFEKISSTEFRMTSLKPLNPVKVDAYIRPNKGQTDVCDITIQQDSEYIFTIFSGSGEDSLTNHPIRIDYYKC